MPFLWGKPSCAVLPGSLPGTLLGKVLPKTRKEQLPTMFWLCSIGVNSVIKASGMTAVVLALLVGLYFLISGLQHKIVKRLHKRPRPNKTLLGGGAHFTLLFMAIPHNSKCRYGKRGAADAKPKAQIILDAAKVSAASGGNSEPKQGQRSQSARGFCPRSTMRVSQPDIIEHFGNADAVPQLPERCLSRKAGIVRCCLSCTSAFSTPVPC